MSRYVYEVRRRIAKDKSRGYSTFYSSLEKAKKAIAFDYCLNRPNISLEWDKASQKVPSNIYFDLMIDGEVVDSLQAWAKEEGWHTYPRCIKKQILH